METMELDRVIDVEEAWDLAYDEEWNAGRVRDVDEAHQEARWESYGRDRDLYRQNVGDALRQAADLIESLGVVERPTLHVESDGEVLLSWTAYSKEAWKTLRAGLGSFRFPRWAKVTKWDSPGLRQRRGLVQLELIAGWGECKQIKVGTERKVVREEVQPARVVEVEKDVPVYEKRCPGLEELLED